MKYPKVIARAGFPAEISVTLHNGLLLAVICLCTSVISTGQTAEEQNFFAPPASENLDAGQLRARSDVGNEETGWYLGLGYHLFDFDRSFQFAVSDDNFDNPYYDLTDRFYSPIYSVVEVRGTDTICQSGASPASYGCVGSAAEIGEGYGLVVGYNFSDHFGLQYTLTGEAFDHFISGQITFPIWESVSPMIDIGMTRFSLEWDGVSWSESTSVIGLGVDIYAESLTFQVGYYFYGDITLDMRAWTKQFINDSSVNVERSSMTIETSALKMSYRYNFK